jgi:hypothetical protein
VSEREQRESELLLSVQRGLSARGVHGEKAVEMPRDEMGDLSDGSDRLGLNSDDVGELVGYDVDGDHNLVRVGEVYRFVSSVSVHDKIIEGGPLYSSVLGVNFDAYDESNEEMIGIDDQDDRAREVSRHDISQRLSRCCRNSWMARSHTSSVFTFA